MLLINVCFLVSYPATGQGCGCALTGKTTRQQDNEGVWDTSLIHVYDVLSETKRPLCRRESIQTDNRDRSETCASQRVLGVELIHLYDDVQTGLQFRT